LLKLYLVDGTYELFRAHFGAPPAHAPDGRAVGAVKGLVQSLLVLLRDPQVTYVACAFDHVVESFRNELYEGYKTGEGVPEELLAQFPLAEEAASALGIAVWSMTEFEADDALATAVAKFAGQPGLEQVVVCTPDKDLAQVVRGNEVVCLDRRRNITLDYAGVWAKFGVGPASIPDYLALVGDSADGIPGISGWGAKASSSVLARYEHIEHIPIDVTDWEDVSIRGAQRVASNLAESREDALLYRRLATLRNDVPLAEDFDDLLWRGVPKDRFEAFCSDLGLERLIDAPTRWM
jgi:5'-3' exonuclease